MVEQVFNNFQYPPIGNFAVGTVTATAGSVQFSNSNGVSFGMDTNGVVTASVAAGGGGIVLGAGTVSITSGTGIFSNANGVSFGISGQTITASIAAQSNQSFGIYGVSNTTGASSSSTADARSLSIQGAGNVSVGWSNGSLVISGATAAGVTTGGLYALGNTVSNSSTTLALSALSFNGIGAVTMGFSNGSIQVSVATQSNQTIGLYAVGNTTQNSSTALDARSISFNGLGNVTLGFSNGSVQVSGPGPFSRYMWPPGNFIPISSYVQGAISIQYVPVYANVTGTRIDLPVIWNGGSSATTATMAIVISAYAMIYSRNGASLSSMSSGSTQVTYTYASNSAGHTEVITAAVKPISVPVNFNMTPGEYYVAFNFSTNSSSVGLSTTNYTQQISVMGGAAISTTTYLNYAEWGSQTTVYNNLSNGMGVYSVTSAGIPTAMSISGIVGTGASLSQANILLVFRNQ